MKGRLFLAHCALVFGALCAMPQGALADMIDDELRETRSFAGRLFETRPVAPGSAACFSRTYSPEHLGRNPVQRVTTMSILLRNERESRDDAARAFTIRLGFGLRGESKGYRTLSDCSRASGETVRNGKLSPSRILCGDSGESEGFVIEAGKVSGTIILRINTIFVGKEGAEDAPAPAYKTGPGDRVFLLNRAPLATCTTIFPDRKAIGDFLKGE